MTHKSIFTSALILIGLSLFFSGCILFAMDPPEERYEARFVNTTESKVLITFDSIFDQGLSDTLLIFPKEGEVALEFVVDDGSKATHQIADFYSNEDGGGFIIELYSEGILKRRWTGTSGVLGNDINTPLNYDSWRLNEDKKMVEFTITNADLIPDE